MLNAFLTTVDWTQVGIALGTIFSGIFIAFVPSVYKYFKAKRKIHSGFDLNKILDNITIGEVYETMFKLREESNATRVRVCKFHNGGNFLDGTPMKKFSATHETCIPGISAISIGQQNVQITLFTDLMKCIRENQPNIVSIEDLPDGSSVKTWAHHHNIDYFSVLPFRQGDLTTGFLVVEWNTQAFNEMNTPTFKELFMECRNSLEYRLGAKDD